MKGIGTLIRLAKFRLDEARRQLAELERLRAHLHQSLDRLASEVSREQQQATQTQIKDPYSGYAAYARVAMDRRSTIEQSIADLAPKLGEAEAAVTAAFQEMKRYEIAEDNHRRRAQEKQQRREQTQLDETGLSRFQRTRQAG
jgi:flagellar protein FliJ